jgi:hypothetical protein
MTIVDAINFIESNDFEAIERITHSSVSIIPTVESIGKIFGLTESEMKEFMQESLGQTDSTRVTDMLRNVVDQIDSKKLEEISARAIVDTMKYVHDIWVENNTYKFFGQKAEQEKQFQYLPLELIGWQEAKLDLKYVAAVVESIGLPINHGLIKQEYDQRVIELLSHCLLSDAKSYPGQATGDVYQMCYDSLYHFIDNGCDGYAAHWTEEIIATMHGDFICDVIMPQLETKGFASDQELMNAIETQGIIPDGLSDVEPQTPGNM